MTAEGLHRTGRISLVKFWGEENRVQLPIAPSHGCGWKEWITPPTKWFMSSHPIPHHPPLLIIHFKCSPMQAVLTATPTATVPQSENLILLPPLIRFPGSIHDENFNYENVAQADVILDRTWADTYTNYVQQCPSWETNCRVASRNISCLLSNPKVYYHDYKSLHLDPTQYKRTPSTGHSSYWEPNSRSDGQYTPPLSWNSEVHF